MSALEALPQAWRKSAITGQLQALASTTQDQRQAAAIEVSCSHRKDASASATAAPSTSVQGATLIEY